MIGVFIRERGRRSFRASRRGIGQERRRRVRSFGKIQKLISSGCGGGCGSNGAGGIVLNGCRFAAFHNGINRRLHAIFSRRRRNCAGGNGGGGGGGGHGFDGSGHERR